MPQLTWATKSLPDPEPAVMSQEAVIFPQGHGYPDALPQHALYLGDNLRVMACLLPQYAGRLDLIYADPPYVLSTRKMKKQYAYEMSDVEHIELLETLKLHRGPVLLSGYDNELYDARLEGWDKFQIETTAEKGFHRTETLWVKQ